jgi:methyl-accepting chemotaxis protein
MFLLRALSSLGTAVKLSLGFGLVLALTLFVAATGFLALRSLSSGFSTLEQFSEINDRVSRMRRTEQAFIQSADDSHKVQLYAQAKAIQEQSLRLQEQLPAERNELQRVSEEVAAYVATFDRFVEQSNGMQLSLEGAKWLVVGASNSLDLLKESLTEDGVNALKQGQLAEGDAAIAQAGQIGTVHMLLLQALEQARVLLGKPFVGDDAPVTIHEAAQAQALAGQLREAVSEPGYSAVLGEVVSNIDSFNLRLQAYTKELLQRQREHAQLLSSADQMLALVEQSFARQKHLLQVQLTGSTWLIVAALVAALLVGLLATWMITRAIVNPLKRVAEIAKRIASGDLTDEIEVQRSDEVGHLLQAMQGMSRDLRTLVGHLQAGVMQLSNSAQTLSSVTERARAGVNEQKAETDQVAAAIVQMAATVHEVARNAESAAFSTAQADSRVSAGGKVVQQTLLCIAQLTDSMSVTRQGLEQLSQDAGNIDAVLDVIKSVAQQTNLLALNAAIEAARAGDQGRGFAVVADEVRALARRTQQSTEEIEGILGVLRQGAGRAVTDVRQSGELLEQVVGNARHTEEALSGIAGAVGIIHGLNQQIAAATEQQTAVAEDLSRSLMAIQNIGERTATTMGENAGSSQQLTSFSLELRAVADRFRL